jgi:hypothetical protein
MPVDDHDRMHERIQRLPLQFFLLADALDTALSAQRMAEAGQQRRDQL